jgi:hypothetical protein
LLQYSKPDYISEYPGYKAANPGLEATRALRNGAHAARPTRSDRHYRQAEGRRVNAHKPKRKPWCPFRRAR